MPEGYAKTEQYASKARPWLKYYAQEDVDAPLPRCTMYEMARRGFQEYGSEASEAIFYYGTRFTYTEFFAKIERYAAAFASQGVKKGDYVSFLTVSIPESIFSVYALNKIGAVCNFIDVRTDAPHVREYIRKAKSQVLITLEQSYGAVADYLDDLNLRLVICQNPADSLPRLKGLAYRLKSPRFSIPYDGKRIVRNAEFAQWGQGLTVQDVAYEPGMPAAVTRTGGTTGLSKGVVLTNDSMNAVAWSFRVSCMKTAAPNGSLLNFLPLGSSYGIAVGVHVVFCLCQKGILIPNFKPSEFDRLVTRFRPNHIVAVPMFYQQLISSPRLRGKDLSFIQTMAAGGDTANDALEDKLEQFRLACNIPYPIAQGYGLSEMSSAVAFGFAGTHRKGSAGIPTLPTVIAAFKPGTEEELPLGEPGELCITGASMMKEYLDEPEETANIVWKHQDGRSWVHTGDIGFVDEDGFVFIVGRIKRAIVRFDGHKVYPLQLERTVMQHPLVHNCVAVGVKDQDHSQGSLPLLVVELESNATASEALRCELLEHCRQETEARAHPVDLVFVERVPLTPLAKNDYRVLEEEYANYRYRRGDL